MKDEVTRRKLTILQIIPKAAIESGGSFQALQLSQGLLNRGHKVTLITRPSAQCQETARKTGVNLRTLPLKHEADLFSMQKLYRIMKKEGTEVVHVHKGLAHTLAYFPSRLAKIPAFVVNRGVIFPLDVFNRIKYHWKGVGAVVAVAEEIRKVLIDKGKLPPEKIVTIYGGTDLKRFDWRISGNDLRRELNIPWENTVIGMIANIRTWKGHDDFLEALYPLLDKYDNLTVLIVGDNRNSYAATLLKEVKKKGFSRRIIFTGYREDIPQVLAAVDFTVISSYDGEGLTGAIRESLAMKKAVVSTRVGGNAEIIEPGKNGFLTPPRDIPALREKIEQLIADNDLRKRMGEEGLKLIKQKFSLTARLDRMEELYYRLVGA